MFKHATQNTNTYDVDMDMDFIFFDFDSIQRKKTLNVAKDFLVRCGQRVRRFYNENFRSKK